MDYPAKDCLVHNEEEAGQTQQAGLGVMAMSKNLPLVGTEPLSPSPQPTTSLINPQCLQKEITKI
jgi:hypothetical protein